MRRRNKYGARRTVKDGIAFDSGKEATMYQELKLLQAAGEIKDLKLQPEFVLQAKFKDAKGKNVREVKYIADFSFYDRKQKRPRVIDCKGYETQVYRIKKKVFNYLMRDRGLYLEENY